MIDNRSDTWVELERRLAQQIDFKKEALTKPTLSEHERDVLCGEIAGLRWVLKQPSAAVVTKIDEVVLDGS